MMCMKICLIKSFLLQDCNAGDDAAAGNLGALIALFSVNGSHPRRHQALACSWMVGGWGLGVQR